jgi:hypothetical protein
MFLQRLPGGLNVNFFSISPVCVIQKLSSSYILSFHSGVVSNFIFILCYDVMWFGLLVIVGH